MGELKKIEKEYSEIKENLGNEKFFKSIEKFRKEEIEKIKKTYKKNKETIVLDIQIIENLKPLQIFQRMQNEAKRKQKGKEIKKYEKTEWLRSTEFRAKYNLSEYQARKLLRSEEIIKERIDPLSRWWWFKFK